MYTDFKTAELQPISANPNCPWLLAKGDCIYLDIQNVPEIVGWASGSSTVLFLHVQNVYGMM